MKLDVIRSGSHDLRACQLDSRFSYCLYIPERCLKAAQPSPLLVYVHGSGRGAENYRDIIVPFAEEMGWVLLCPLFPCGITSPTDTESYKFVYHPAVRFDHILLSMIDEVAQSVSISTEKFYLGGYSGGGQFAHRFLYGYPDRLHAVSIGAPGNVTLAYNDKPWWVGTKGLERYLGHPVDFEHIKRVPIVLVIGDQDISSEDVVSPLSSPHYMEGANECGKNRIERLNALSKSLKEQDILSNLEIIPNVAHEGFAILGKVFDFFRKVDRTGDTPDGVGTSLEVGT